MFQKALIVFLNISGNFHSVNGSAAPFLFDMSAETKGLSATARILPFVASILKLWFLRVIPTMKQLTPHELRFTHCAFESNEASPDLPIDILPLDGLLIVHVLNETV